MIKKMTAVLLALFLCGCGKLTDVELPSNVVIGMSMTEDDLIRINNETLTTAQAKMILSAQKQVTEEAFGPEIWSVEASEDDTYESLVMASVKEFLAKLLSMRLMAEENGISLSAAEKEAINRCTEIYMKQSDVSVLKELGITQETVFETFSAYYSYHNLINTFTADMIAEVSYNDARVGDGYVVVIKKEGSDRYDEAKKIRKELKKSDNILAACEEYNESGKVERTIKRGDLPDAVEEAFFSLSDGEFTPVIETDSRYYIVYCLEDYDSEATKKNRNALINAQKEAQFNSEYVSFIKGLSVEVNNDVWEKQSISQIPVTGADFFSIYRDTVENMN